jgi:hypothetical protein
MGFSSVRSPSNTWHFHPLPHKRSQQFPLVQYPCIQILEMGNWKGIFPNLFLPPLDFVSSSWFRCPLFLVSITLLRSPFPSTQPLEYKLGYLNSQKRNCNGVCHLPVYLNVRHTILPTLFTLTLFATTESKSYLICLTTNKCNSIYRKADILSYYCSISSK